jgi:hypothetical protein
MCPNCKSSNLLLKAILTLAPLHTFLFAQTDSQNLSRDTASASAPVAPSPNKAKASLFYFLAMSGKTQDQFVPLTQKKRAEAYAKGLFSPFLFFTAGSSAGITQWQDVPHSWGQGGEGYGRRFGNYFAKQSITRTLRWWGEAALHEDNRYFQSGKHGLWARTKYAAASSVLARHDDGKQYLSYSRLGSNAGAAFISRIWQPSTNNSPGDGAVSFGISMGTNAGLNVFKEFLPDILGVFSHRGRQTDTK